MRDPSRYVAGVEQDPGAAMTARERLDDVFMLNVQVDTPPLEPGSLDCVSLGDVLEHLVDPETCFGATGSCCAPTVWR